MAMVREGVGTGDGPTSSPVRLGLGKGIKDLQPITQLWIPFFPDPLHSGEAEGWGVEACCHRMVGGEGAAVIWPWSAPGKQRGNPWPPKEALVLKELSDPAGAIIYTSRFQVGASP